MKSDHMQHEDGTISEGKTIQPGELNEALHIIGHPDVPQKPSEVVKAPEVKVIRHGVEHDDGTQPLLDAP